MKKITNKRLTVDRETLRVLRVALAGDQLRYVDGGRRITDTDTDTGSSQPACGCCSSVIFTGTFRA
jgi:hypothetical protein